MFIVLFSRDREYKLHQKIKKAQSVSGLFNKRLKFGNINKLKILIHDRAFLKFLNYLYILYE